MSADTRFLQIHTLTPYAATLLNRDDIGRAKRLPFGGADRIRVSSQSLKRHWRRSVDEWSLERLDGGLAVRSRHVFDWQIAPKLQAEGIPDAVIGAVLRAFKAKLLGESDKAKAGAAKASAEEPLAGLMTQQVIVLGKPEIEYVTRSAIEVAAGVTDEKAAAEAVATFFKNRERADNFRALIRGAGLDAAMFGRMVTSDILARCDAAVHVAHAFTVNAEEAEPDYFTAVDDLTQDAGEQGSGHINSTELTSGLFYGYVVVDVPKLVENLAGDAALASRSVESLLHLIATVSPGAKLGSTAPYAYSELMMVEAGTRQPRSLANAFMRPVADRGLQEAAISAMSNYLSRLDGMYKGVEDRRFASVHDAAAFPAERMDSLDAVASWAASQVAEAAG